MVIGLIYYVYASLGLAQHCHSLQIHPLHLLFPYCWHLLGLHLLRLSDKLDPPALEDLLKLCSSDLFAESVQMVSMRHRIKYNRAGVALN